MENLGSYDAGVPFRKFILIFLFVSLVVGTGVVYSALSKATITIIPKSTIKEVSTEVTIDGNVTTPDFEKGILSGEIVFRETEGQKKEIEILNKKVDEFARGKVLIRNNTPYTQGVRQGALLHPVGAPPEVTFATTSRVMLAPKQSKEAEIVATFKGAKGNLPPGKFEFLNLETKYMRDNLWAENQGKIEGGIREAKILTQEDLDRADLELSKQMFEKTIEEINKSLEGGRVVKKESSHYTVVDKRSSIPVGTEADSFDIAQKIEVQAVTINEKDLEDIAERKIKNLTGTDEEFIKVEPGSFSYELVELDIGLKKAILRVKLKGDFRSKLSSKVFDKKSIIGYNEAAIREHFAKYDNIENIKVQFWPPFRKTVPNMENRVEIEVRTE